MTHVVSVAELTSLVSTVDDPTSVDTALTNALVQTVASTSTIGVSPYTIIDQSTGGDSYLGAVAADIAAADTSFVLDGTTAALLAEGSYIAVGALTTKCEIRRVTAIAAETLTLESALKFDHAQNENVWVLTDTWVTPEWFGCKPNSTFDSFAGLQQAFNDNALGARFGLTGHTNRYYSSTPLVIYDNMRLEQIAITVKTPLSIDPTLGLRNSEPDQFFVTLAGQVGTISAVNTTTNTLTLSGSAGATAGDRLIFYPNQGDTLPAPLEAGRSYYIKTFAGLNYTISVDLGGSELDITSAGSGTTYFYSTGLARMQWNSVTLEGANTRGLNGLIAYLQQPSVSYNLRCDAFPGPKGCAVITGQQGDFYTPMFLHGAIGLNLQGGKYMYMHGGSFEACDILVQTDTTDLYGSAVGNTDIQFFGGHWETPGIGTCQIQTVIGNAAVSAGTFTLTFAGQTTTGIAYNATAATIQTALEALSNIAPGDVVVTQEVGLLSAGGRMVCTFAGQYQWAVVSIMTLSSTGLTGGTYTPSRISPNAKALSIKTGGGIGVWGGRFSGSTKPDGTGADFLVLESSATTTSGYVVQNVNSAGQLGNAVNDIPRGLTRAWADTTGCAERLGYYAASGYHAGSGAKTWTLAGRLGQEVVWDEYVGEFRFNGNAKVRFGDTGPLFTTNAGTPESTVTAPVGSICADSTNGVLYMKKTGTGNTGWKLVTQAA